MRNYTIKWGKFLLLRWLVASWILHGVHVFDKTERLYYVLCESLIVMTVCLILFFGGYYDIEIYLVYFILIHTITWLVDSHWLVGYREVDKSFRGKGIGSVIEFAELSKQKLSKFESVEAIAIYGSLCRRMYHDRSDMDLRVLQRGKSFRLFLEIQILRFIGIWKFKIPLDLKLVDSVDYLKNEMRIDEKPIMVYKKHDVFYNEGDSFTDLKDNPRKYLKITPPLTLINSSIAA